MDPLQAANLVLTVWDLLRGAAGQPEQPTPTVGTTVVPGEGLDAAARHNAEMQQARIDHLVLVTHAMWTLLSEKMGVTEADLAKRVTELDAADGAVDGKELPTKPVPRCSCGAAICRKMNRCLFCGKPYEGGNTFDTL